jgi:hypothetical protein
MQSLLSSSLTTWQALPKAFLIKKPETFPQANENHPRNETKYADAVKSPGQCGPKL